MDIERTAAPATRKLRVGLFLDGLVVPRWIASIADEIVGSANCEAFGISLGAATGAPGSRVADAPRFNTRSLAQLYLHLDYSLFHPTLDAMEPVDIAWQLAPSNKLSAEPKFDGPYFSFDVADEQRLKALDLDVLLLLASGLAGESVLPLARAGVWYFNDQERSSNGRTPLGFSEVLRQEPVTTLLLVAAVAGVAEPIALHRHDGPTHHRSVRLCRNNLLLRSASIVARQLQRLHRVGSLPTKPHGNGIEDPGGVHAAWSNVVMARSAASQVSRFVRDQIDHRRYLDQWAIGYVYDAVDAPTTLDRYRWLVPTSDRCWADPFPVHTEEQDFLFFEEYFYGDGRGRLCAAPIDRDGFVEAPRTILECPYHLSYPFVFSWEGERYLIPETQDANRLDVYKFRSFPYQLEFHRTLMHNVRAVDATLFEAKDQWWMFVGLAAAGSWNVDDVSLFFADTPFGPWTSHPSNPIRSDIRAARPAGRIFGRNGAFYRPAQDCSRGYGYAIRVQEILALSKTDYAEREAQVILPDPSLGIVATHTFNVDGPLTVTDAKKRRRR